MLLPLPTTGRVFPLPSVGSHSTSRGTLLRRGTCSWRTTTYPKPLGQSIGQRSWHSLCCVQFGFEHFLRSHQLGLSQRRAEWFTRWTREVAQAGHINISTLEEGLGRVMYVAGALEYERPFLAPLYKFMTVHPRGSDRKVLAYVSFFQ